MCLLTLRSTDNKDGTIQQGDPPTSCKDGRQDFNIQQFSSIEEHEREASTSCIKTPCSIRNKLEAAINLDRSLNADAVEDEDLGELRATLESADDNLKTQMLQNETNNLKEDYPKLEMKKDKMCLKTSNTQGEIQQEKQLTSCEDCSTDILVRQCSVNYQNEGCTDQHNALKHPEPIFKKKIYWKLLFEIYQNQFNSLRRSSLSIMAKREIDAIILKEESQCEFMIMMLEGKSQREVMEMRRQGKSQREVMEMRLQVAEGIFSKKLRDLMRKIEGLIEEEKIQTERISLAEKKKKNERIILTEMKHGEKEHTRQLFLMLLLIILIKNISENIKCRQTSCRKYPCLNSIMYLLWQSGDVEVNPGPANSTTYRKWLFEVCPVVRKVIAGVSTDCKMNKIWQQKPENWPSKKLYFNPRGKGHSVNKVEDLLINLLHCCDTSKLSHDINSEIDTWKAHRSKDNGKLLHLYRTRECCMSIEQVNISLKVLQNHIAAYEALINEGNTCIRISLPCQPAIDQQVITHNIYRAEATRKISSFLCRILHCKDPEKKCDHIWTIKPDEWPTHLRYYNPNNGGERWVENEDGMVVEALITLCEKKSIILPKSYQDMVDAWQADDQTLLSKLLTRHKAETDLKKAVMNLHEEGLLQDQEVDKQLREIGLLVQCDGSTQNVKSQKRKRVSTNKKHGTKITKQSDHEDAVDRTLKELLPKCSIGQLMDNQSDSFLLDKISQNIPDFLGDEADNIQFHWI